MQTVQLQKMIAALLFAISPAAAAELSTSERSIMGCSCVNGTCMESACARNGCCPPECLLDRKTLFSWDGLDNADDAGDEEEPIKTDRPDFTESSSTVGRGTIQLESGYTFIHDSSGGVEVSVHSFPEMLWRVGVLADWLELRLGWNYSVERVRVGGAAATADGAEDLYLGIKLALTEQDGILPEMALMPQMTVPTGARVFMSDEVMPGLNWLYSWDLNECISAGGSTQANRAIEGSGNFYTEFAQSATIGYTLTERLGAYTEWFALFPHEAVDPDTEVEHYFNGGFTFLVNNNVQLDIRAGLGLNEAADNFFTGSGASFRW